VRTWETVQIAAIATAIGLPVLLGSRLKRGRMAGVLFAAMVAQLLVEGYRWQLFPMEITTVALAMGDLILDERRIRGLQRFRRGVLGPLGVAGVALLPALFPIPELPVPTGPFAVGTQTFVIIDEERLEEYGLTDAEEDEAGEPADPGRPRRFVVQAWYPAVDVDGLEPSPWNPDFDVVGPAMARRLGFPGFFLNHVADVRSSSYVDATPVSGRLPVVIYSHGWTGFRTIALNQMEALASRGFIVLAADHTHAAVAEVFPNGDVVEYDPLALPDEDDVGPTAYQAASERLVVTMAGDIAAMLDGLEQRPVGPFARLRPEPDLRRVGVYGHSTGGGAAVRVCLEDARCGAVLGLDAWVIPIPDRVVARELSQPSMFIRSDGWRGTPNDGRLRGLAERSPRESYWLDLAGAGHNDFVLTPLFSPVADRIGLKGPIPADRVIAILDTYLVAFFQRHLLDAGGAALDERPPSEVSLEFLP
jgi:predicted dienelactone hydrolase